MNVGILLFEQFHGRKQIGSSRIRGHWLAKYWPDAEIFRQGVKYDAVIFQKVYWVEFAEKYPGIKILDLCDPDWLEWGTRIKQMINACDAVTCNTIQTAKYIMQLTEKPVWVVPDRMDLEFFPEVKDHRGKGRAKTVGWHGYHHNFTMVDSALSAIEKLGLELVVISDKPYSLPHKYDPARMLDDAGPDAPKDAEPLPNEPTRRVIELRNFSYSDETVNRDLLTCDILINPQAGGPRWRYKSNNKTLSGWALGLPVAHDGKELISFMDEEARVAEAEKRRAEVEKLWDVKLSVESMKKLIAEIAAKR